MALREKFMEYELNQSAYIKASKAVADFVKSKLGEPKYQLERRDPTGRDYSMTPIKSGDCEVWTLNDCFGDFFNAPNGETSATYVSGFGLAAKTYENDIFEIVDNVVSVDVQFHQCTSAQLSPILASAAIGIRML